MKNSIEKKNRKRELKEGFASKSSGTNIWSILFIIFIIIIYIGVAVLYFLSEIRPTNNTYGPLIATMWPFIAFKELAIISHKRILEMYGKLYPGFANSSTVPSGQKTSIFSSVKNLFSKGKNTTAPAPVTSAPAPAPVTAPAPAPVTAPAPAPV